MKPSGARRWTVLYLAAGGLFLCAAALSCAYLLLLQASPLDGRAQILLVLILSTCTAAAILIALFTLLHVFIFRPLEVRRPGLCIQVARLHSRPLDLSTPLWEFTIIEGLDNIEGLPPDCYAIVSKVHHACVDGVSGIDMIEAVHDLDPTRPNLQPSDKPWKGEDEPSPFELLTRASINNALQPFRFAEVAARTIPALAKLGEGVREGRFTAMKPVPRTRFNGTVTAHRVVEGRSFDLKAFRAMKNVVPKRRSVRSIVRGAREHPAWPRG